MSEHITQSTIEDAIDSTNSFLYGARGASLDGEFAAGQIARKVMTVADQAEDLLTSVPFPGRDGLYVPLSRHNANRYNEATTVLAGHLVLVQSNLVERGTSAFYPAVVSEDGARSQNLRLHVLRQPYRQAMTHAASTLLSAAGQSETTGIGSHSRTTSDGVEAEHFATILTLSDNAAGQNAWRNGVHANHAWRRQPGNSVTSALSQRLFGPGLQQKTVTITREQVAKGQASLFWHEGMRNTSTGKPESATRKKALLVAQGLGYQALRNNNPQNLDNVKRLLS